MVTLSSMWERIQSSLFHFLEEELGELSKKQHKFVSTLEIIRIEDALFYEYRTGRRKSDRKAIASAFVAKAIYNMSTNRELHDRLACDTVLRRICGWKPQHSIPDESTFSRAFAEFADSRLPDEAHKALINKFMSDHWWVILA